jgi:hypothetical protein
MFYTSLCLHISNLMYILLLQVINSLNSVTRLLWTEVNLLVSFMLTVGIASHEKLGYLLTSSNSA